VSLAERALLVQEAIDFDEKWKQSIPFNPAIFYPNPPSVPGGNKASSFIPS